MKLFRNNRVYVQMNDVMFAMSHSDSVPGVVVNQIFKGIVIVTNDNKMDFVNFDDKTAINYFKSLDFIVNYDDYKDLSIEELDAKAEELIEKIGVVADKYNGLSEEKRAKHHDLVDEYEKLEYVINCLGEIKGIKLGTNHMDIPEENTTSKDDITVNTKSTVETNKPKKKGIKTFIKEKLFNKR